MRDSETQDSYRSRLFSDERLEEKARLFEAVTLPSLKKVLQRSDSYLVVMTAEGLPAKYQARLEEQVADLPRATIQYFPPIHRFQSVAASAVNSVISSAPSKRVCIATVRIDDDDGLADDFGEMVAEYLRPEFSGFWLSFPMGLRLVKSGRSFTLTQSYMPKIAAGLGKVECLEQSQIPETAYSIASHAKIDRREPVIVDARKQAYLRTHHGHNDTNMGSLQWARNWVQQSAEDEIQAEIAGKSFSISFEKLGGFKSKSRAKKIFSPVAQLVYRKA